LRSAPIRVSARALENSFADGSEASLATASSACRSENPVERLLATSARISGS